MPETEQIIIQRLQAQLQKSQHERKQLQTELDAMLYERLNNPSFKSSLEQDLKESSEWIGVLQLKLSESKQINVRYEGQLFEANTRFHYATEEIEKLQSELEKICKENEELSEKLVQTEERLIHISSQEPPKEQIEVQVHSLLKQLEEQESQTTIAQQHFAKKVKENSLLKLEMEQKEAMIFALQNQLEKAEGKIAEITHLHEIRQEQEQKVQKMMSETIKSLELQVSTWEEKTSYLSEKLHQLEERNQELKKIEENYKQLQTLLANVGSVFDPYGGTKSREVELRSGTGSSIYLKKS